MLTALAVLGGFGLDLLLADPAWMPHPVVGMGRAIAALEKRLRRLFPATPAGERAAGRVLAAALPLGTFALAAGALALAYRLHPAAGFALETLWCWQALALRGLADESGKVYAQLAKGGAGYRLPHRCRGDQSRRGDGGRKLFGRGGRPSVLPADRGRAPGPGL